MSHFLAPLLSAGATPLALVNSRTGVVLASHVELATSSATRRRGLLGRDALEDGHALVLAPCAAVHTWFMRFTIDIAFTSRDGRVLKTAERVGPWGMRGSLRAFAAIELPAGALRSSGVARGDCVLVRAAS